MPTSGSRGAVIEEFIMYEKEVEMFMNVLPQLSQIAGDAFFAAKCFYATRDPERMIVFHDLKSLGYIMANRHAGLDYDHCALIMSKIGKLHAASIKFASGNRDVLDKYFHFSLFPPVEQRKSDCITVVFQKGFETLVSTIEDSWDDFDPAVLAKLKRLLPFYLTKLEACMTQKVEDGYCVLNHGDLWCNNMLFKYDEKSGRVDDVVFVDYQICYYSSPGIDLNYALANCPDLKTRDREEELIQVYHRSLKEAMQTIGLENIPSLADVKRERKRMEFWSFVSIVSILPIVMMERTDTVEASFEAMVDEKVAEKARKIQYSGKLYQAIVKPMLKRFDQRGLLEV
ncbi:uncharacterized protein LOC129740411 isoform X2 [Uranotaenia lowii]|nr:uncharacterized protein LOC129740411 isoform X2 [Uranotaenia lowii]